MSRTSAARIAWALAALAVGLHVSGHVFVVLGVGVGTPGDDAVGLEETGHYVAFYAFPLVGAVIATRRPGNAIGWLFLATGIASGLTFAGTRYADYAVFAERGDLPAGPWIAAAAWFLDALFFLGIVLLVLLFPEGRLPSRRWRPVVAALVAGVLAIAASTAVKPGLVSEASLPIENPAGIGGIQPLRSVVEVVGVLLFLPATVLICGGAVVRFRRARGVERQQFKWFALATSFLLVAFLATAVSPGAPGRVLHALIGFAFASLAAAVGIAILRYRLYEIDRLISRTLVYAALTVILGAAYAVLVLAGQAVFSSFAGGSDLAIAVSTLVVAALFLPARARVQRFVDRRFYRRRYNAQRTLEAFGSRLRREVELEALSGDLRVVVAETVQPAHVSLWLREVPAMRRAWTWWLAWGLCALFVALTVATLALDASTKLSSEPEESFWGDLGLVVAFAAFAAVGALVAARLPSNAVGWLFLAAPLFALLGAFSQEYAYRTLIVDEGSLPLGLVFAWFAGWTWFPALGAIGLVGLVFPDGRLPGRRWRPVLWVYCAALLLATIGAAIYPGPIDETSGAPDKPLTIEGSEAFLDLAAQLAGFIFVFLLGALVTSIVVRFRRSRGRERQQLKWMLVAVAFLVCDVIVEEMIGLPDELANVLFTIAIASIPIAAGVAILKHRLYDVDVVIRKTLVYGALTVLLGAAYIALVLAGQALFSSFAGGSDLAIAGSTLVVAALFLPLRHRVRSTVDRRFYRRRYDAQRTLESFGGRLRDEVDLSTLADDLRAVVAETMQPSQVSLWLRRESIR